MAPGLPLHLDSEMCSKVHKLGYLGSVMTELYSALASDRWDTRREVIVLPAAVIVNDGLQVRNKIVRLRRCVHAVKRRRICFTKK